MGKSNGTLLEDESASYQARVCRDYVDAGKPRKTELDKEKYKLCCDKLFFCEFWMQSWFWWTVAGVTLLVIILSVVCCIWCCCCRRTPCGADMKMSDEVENQTQSDAEIGPFDSGESG
ncbi:hypothetical protein GCK72_008121 [Caenorhabditis remanei]|nr:hypothetical protein GCK72_008121 [Caenorhabditis remanei]KAF1768159.1 hypothetical protein GCK72_008121 [Caenorhabditis remanei]